MSEDNVTKLDEVREAFKGAKKHTPTDKTKRAKPGGGSGDGGKPPPPPETFGRVWRLPNDSPVKALGHNGTEYHFLAKSGQRTSLQAKELRGPVIVHLFGEERYLIKYWPSFDKNGMPTGDWKTGRLPGVLIATCQDVGLWDPADKERGIGCWAEDDGTLVFHCGDILVTSKGRVGTGLRERLLYPSAPRVPEPILDAKPGKGAEFALHTWGPRNWSEVEGAGARIMERLVTWNFARPHTDAMLLLGLIGCCLLGAAPDWRPMGFLTGDSRTGKSTLLKGIKWILGEGAFVSSGNATQAAIARKVGNSSRPVILDELERKEDNSQAQKLIELMVLASSGETLDRGTPGTETNSFIARNCFLMSAISPPPLNPQDLNRLVIIELGRLAGDVVEEDAAEDAEEEASKHVDRVWGSRADAERLGQLLRGRLLAGWPRYHRTIRRYFKALQKQGHDRRGADQFGALLTAYDLIMFQDDDEARAAAFAALLPAKQIAETAGSVSNHEACLQYLLAAQPPTIRGGTTETVSHWMRKGKAELGRIGDNADEENSDALRTLAKIGVKLFRDKRFSETDKPSWTVAISNESDNMATIFRHSKWSKASGSTAGWPQMFKRLEGAETHTAGGNKLRIWIDGVRHYVTYVPWDTIFPVGDKDVDAIEKETMDTRDRSR